LTQDQAQAGEQTGELLSNPGAQSMAIQDQLMAQGQTIAPAQPAQSPDGAPSTAQEAFLRQIKP
jgi:hypothetical protein